MYKCIIIDWRQKYKIALFTNYSQDRISLIKNKNTERVHQALHTIQFEH